MSKKFLVDIDLNGNELQNGVVQNLASAPENPKAGQHYFNTTSHKEFVYNGTSWIEVTSQGDYTFQNGLEQTDGTRNVQIKVATGDNAGNVTLTANSNGLAASVDLSGKVDKNDAITAGTHTKITYDAKGLVTAGADLEASDIPSLSLSKISDVTASAAEVNVLDGITATTAELNILDGVTADASEINILDGATLTTTELNYVDGVTSSIQDQLDSKVAKNTAITAGTGTVISYDAKGLVTGSSELGIKSGSTNYLEYDSANHEFGAKVDTNVTANSTNLVTSGAVKAAIDAAVTGGVHYAGTWDITSATDYSGITLPQTKGAMFYVTGTGPKTIGGIEWNEGDYLLFNADVASGGTVTGKVDKIDNTESSDLVKLNATQTLTNKTIDADDNTISDLTTSNLKSGVLQTSVRAATSASDTTLASEKAIRTELDTKQNKVTAAVENNLATWDEAGSTKDSGKAFITSITDSSTNTDNQIPTAKAVASFVESSISGGKYSVDNTAMTGVSGVCTWSISSLANDPYSVVIVEKATGDEVVADVTYGSKAVTIKFNAASIAAGTYQARILM